MERVSNPYANVFDHAVAGRYEAREADWRNGALVYQVIVDRFAPSADLEAKAHLYPAPKKLRTWDETPKIGTYLDSHEVWSHEIDFWGGDLASLRDNLDYIESLGVDVLYLCPIHDAWTNHGYDAFDYNAIRAEYGTRDDVRALADDLHARGMRLVLDGVFNHMGRQSPFFQEALANPDAPQRDWFAIDDTLPGGARAWANAINLPELVFENEAVRDHIYAADDSVVRSFLRDGVDGWRLDVAFEIGMAHLAELTAAAHDEKPGSLVLGEVANYPKEWFPALDAVLNFTWREIILGMAAGHIAPAHAQRMLQRFYADADFEHLLKSWNYLDNHDVDRVATTLPNVEAHKLASVLQFTLPGSVNLYYGSELGQDGGRDPQNRAPFRWDLVNSDNPYLSWYHRLIGLRRTHRALRVGDLRWLETDQLIGFERHTDQIADAIFVIANPSPLPVTESVLLPDSKVMDMSGLIDLLTGQRHGTHRALIHVTVQPHGVLVLTPDTAPNNTYTPYKRVQ